MLSQQTRAQMYRRAARRMFHDAGTLEVELNARVSQGEDKGAYVGTWVWVSYADVGICGYGHYTVAEGQDKCVNCIKAEADEVQP